MSAGLRDLSRWLIHWAAHLHVSSWPGFHQTWFGVGQIRWVALERPLACPAESLTAFRQTLGRDEGWPKTRFSTDSVLRVKVPSSCQQTFVFNVHKLSAYQTHGFIHLASTSDSYRHIKTHVAGLHWWQVSGSLLFQHVGTRFHDAVPISRNTGSISESTVSGACFA